LVGLREHVDPFDNMGFGQPVEDISPSANQFLAFNSGLFTEQIWFLADALHAGIDEVTATVEAIPAEQDHQICDHLLRAGTTAGQRWTWTGRRADKPLIEIEALWTVGGEYPGHWPTPEHGWTLTIEGDPSMRVHFFALASFTRRGDDGRTRPRGRRGHRHAGAQRGARGLRRSTRLRHDGLATAYPQPQRIQQHIAGWPMISGRGDLSARA
jgi:hypothetical protein